MEVVPSLYKFIKRLKKEGYNVKGLPSTLEEFNREVMSKGSVVGDYAPAAQEKFMNEGKPLWIKKEEYQKWAEEILLP